MNMVNLAVKACYERGGSPDTIISDPALKVKLSALGGATLAALQTATKGDKPAHAINAVDVIGTDFVQSLASAINLGIFDRLIL